MELVTDPSILFLDEPTSGLDSATSLIIIDLLHKLSRQINTNIICVIHQPRIELFELFDNLTLLTSNGRLVYNGKASLIKSYFENLGFDFPDHSNPSDILMDILSGFMVSEKCTVRDLYKQWQTNKAEYPLSHLSQEEENEQKDDDDGDDDDDNDDGEKKKVMMTDVDDEKLHQFKLDGTWSCTIENNNISINNNTVNSNGDATDSNRNNNINNHNNTNNNDKTNPNINNTAHTININGDITNNTSTSNTNGNITTNNAEKNPKTGIDFEGIDHKRRGYLDQLVVMVFRDLTIRFRCFNRTLGEIIAGFLIGLILGFLFRTIHVGKEIVKVNLEVTCASLMTSVIALKTFGRDCHIFLKESHSGVHTLSYFLAKIITDLPKVLFFIPISFLGIYWSGGEFKATFGEAYMDTAMMVFAASGFSYVISVLFESNTESLVAIALSLVVSMFAGCSLTICELDGFTVLGPVLYHISYAKWYVQSRLLTEYSLYSEVYATHRTYYINKNQYDAVDGRLQAILVMVLLGVVSRLVTFLILLYRKSNFSMSQLVYRCVKQVNRRRLKTKQADAHITPSA